MSWVTKNSQNLVKGDHSELCSSEAQWDNKLSTQCSRPRVSIPTQRPKAYSVWPLNTGKGFPHSHSPTGARHSSMGLWVFWDIESENVLGTI